MNSNENDASESSEAKNDARPASALPMLVAFVVLLGLVIAYGVFAD